MLADIDTGYPLMLCDMTLLTAIRTAVTSALAAKYLAKPDSKIVGFIGTGAQAEFQLLALATQFNIETIKYYDVDPKAMEKFRANFDDKFNMIACKDTREATEGVDIITTAINTKKKVQLVKYDWIKDRDDLFINAMGGDCPGKTELESEILKHSKIVLEFYPQTKHEGEIQNLDYEPEYTELWELVTGEKPGRTKDDKIIVFDSVGFGLADFSILKVIYEKGLGKDSEVLPAISDPKNLYELVV
jgi:ornithine cyclodeaminase